MPSSLDRCAPIPSDLLVPEEGPAPRNVAAHSHWRTPLDQNSLGYSRNWGGASRAVQQRVVDEVIRQMPGHALRETGFALAVARFESGFNPDAAAGTSSASGVGQFIEATGRAYGLTEANRFSLVDGVTALLQHLRDIRRTVSPTDEARLYGIYHDGPTLQHGGMEKARRFVIPLADRFERWLRTCR